MAIPLVGFGDGDAAQPCDVILDVYSYNANRDVAEDEQFWKVIRLVLVGVLLIVDAELATCLPEDDAPDIVISAPFGL